MKKKYIFLISIVIILLLIIISLIIYINKIKNDNKEIVIEATVLFKESDYMLVTTDKDVDYIVDTTDTDYQIGDILKLTLIKVKDKKEPIEAKAKYIEVIKRKEIEDNIESNNNEDIKVEDNSFNTNNTTTYENNTTSNEESNWTEEKILEYFNNINTELNNYKEDNSTKETIKAKFINIIDFIFYDGSIDGMKFNDLTSSAKLKIISIALSIDSKIENIIPGYKDTINEKYHNIKNNLIEKYLDITTTICNNDETLCSDAKEGFKDLKFNFGITWDLIKDLAGSGINKLKEWYKIWKYN